MASVVVAVAAAVASNLTAATVGALIAKALIGAVINIGLSAVSNALFGKKASGSGQTKKWGDQRILTFREAVQPRPIIYGEVRTGGAITFVDVKGSTLYMVISLAGHQCAGIGDVFFNEDEVPLDAAGNAIGKYAGKAKVRKYLGSPDQQADARLVSAFAEWTEDHVGKGVTFLVVELVYDSDLYPNGVPTISAIVRGYEVYDPRTGLTEWSDNAVLCINHYLTNTVYGPGARLDEVPEEMVVAQANICDEAVEVAGVDRAAAGPVASATVEERFKTVWEAPATQSGGHGGGSADPSNQHDRGTSGSSGPADNGFQEGATVGI